jgi:hypothetical protein
MFIIYRSQTAMIPLAQTWEEADDCLRTAILSATYNLDKMLQDAPQEQGESRTRKTRVVFHAPLGVLYQVDEDKQMVHILRAWAYQVKSQKPEPLE